MAASEVLYQRERTEEHDGHKTIPRGKFSSKLNKSHRDTYEAMHVRALTAELEVTNLQVQLRSAQQDLKQQKSTVVFLADQLASTQLDTNDIPIAAGDTTLLDQKQVSKKEDDCSTSPVEQLVGGALMRSVLEYKTGITSQHNFMSAVDLLYSMLPPALAAGLQTAVFDNVSLRELTLLPSPRRRQAHLQILMSKCRPISKMKSRRHRNTPPPVPPRPPMMQNSIEPRSAPPVSWMHRHHTAQADSDSDFEDSEVVHKIRFSARAGSVPDVVRTPSLSKQPKPTKISLSGSMKKKKFSLRRSRSADFLESPCVGHRGSITPSESVAYSLPFQHIERWRRMIGISDSSAVTGSMPCLDCENSFEYVDTGQFRDIVTCVREKSIKMGSQAPGRVMKRVDSIVRTHRSRAATNLYSSAVYLSLVGGEEDQLPWLADSDAMAPSNPPINTQYAIEKNRSLPATANRTVGNQYSPATTNRTIGNQYSPVTANRTVANQSLPATANRTIGNQYSPATTNRTVGFKCDTSQQTAGSTPSSPLKKTHTYSTRGSSAPILPSVPRPPVPPRPTILASDISSNHSIKDDKGCLRLVPLISGLEDDDSNYSLGTFQLMMNQQEEHTAGASPTSSDSSDSDEYEIPPDALQGYIEDTPLTRERKYTTNLRSTMREDMVSEKCGYMHKLDPRLKHWTKRWFVLRDKELKYYRSKDHHAKPKGVINLAGWCRITRHELTSSFQLATPSRTYHFVADSNAECEDWIRVLQTVMRLCQECSTATGSKESLTGSARVIMSGGKHVMKTWAALHSANLSLHSTTTGSKIIRSIDLTQYKMRKGTSGDTIRGGSPSGNTAIIIEPIEEGTTNRERETTIQLSSVSERDEWFYAMIVATAGPNGPELTMTEVLVAKLMRQQDEQPPTGSSTARPLRSHSELSYTPDLLKEPLTSLPSAALNEQAIGMFKTVQTFVSTKFNPLALDYHILSLQQLTTLCMANPILQDELYCQVIRQISSPSSDPLSLSSQQAWFLLYLLLPLFLPKRQLFVWYLKEFLSRRSCENNVINDLAQHCENRLIRTQKNGVREKKPSWFELHWLLSRSVHLPRILNIKLKLPVHLLNDTKLEMTFDSSTLVQEFVSHLNMEVGMEGVPTTGFALMSDWPGEDEVDGFYLFPTSKLCDVITMWTESLAELGTSLVTQTRTIRLVYRKRVWRKARSGQETDKEALLNAYQVIKDVLSDRYPVSSQDFAADLAAMMTQIEYGDQSSSTTSRVQEIARDSVKRFCSMKFTKDAMTYDKEMIVSKLIHKWKGYSGLTRSKCAHMLLDIAAQHWKMLGSTLFYCKDRYAVLTPQKNTPLWMAVHEDGISLLHLNSMKVITEFSYKLVATFGGQEEDFMLVINHPQQQQQRPGGRPSLQTEKILLSMSKLAIREATYLMASYLDS